MPGVPLGTTNDLMAAQGRALVQRRPHHDVVRAVTGGDVDLLAVDDVVVAVERRGGLDLAGVEPRPAPPRATHPPHARPGRASTSSPEVPLSPERARSMSLARSATAR